jgi:hypothetical protein
MATAIANSIKAPNSRFYNSGCGRICEITSNAELVVFYFDGDPYDGTNGIVGKISSDGGHTFTGLDGAGTETTIVAAASIATRSQFNIVKDSENNIFLFYTDESYNVCFKKLTYSSGTYSVGSEIVITTNSSTYTYAQDVSAVLTPSNRLWISYSTYTTGNSCAIYVKYSDNEGISWSAPETLASSLSASSLSTTIFPNSSISLVGSDIFLLYYDHATALIKYRQYSGTWGSVATANALTHTNGKNFGLSIPSRNWLVEYSIKNAYVSVWDGKSWTNSNTKSFTQLNSSWNDGYSSQGVVYGDDFWIFTCSKVGYGGSYSLFTRKYSGEGEYDLNNWSELKEVTAVNSDSRYIYTPQSIPDAWINKGFNFIPYFYIDSNDDLVFDKYPINNVVSAKARIKSGVSFTAHYEEVSTIDNTGTMLPSGDKETNFHRSSNGELIYLGFEYVGTINSILSFKTSSDKTTWSSKTTVFNRLFVSPLLDTISFHSCIDASNNVHVVMLGYDAGGTNQQIIYKKLTYSEGSWSVGSEVEIGVTDETYIAFYSPKILVDGSGHIWICFTCYDIAGEIWQGRWSKSINGGSSFSEPSTLSSTSFTAQADIRSLSLKIDGFPQVGLTFGTDSYARIEWSDGDWSIEEEFFGIKGSKTNGKILSDFTTGYTYFVCARGHSAYLDFNGQVVYGRRSNENRYFENFPKCAAPSENSATNQTIWPLLRNNKLIAIGCLNNGETNQDIWFGEFTFNGGSELTVSEFVTNSNYCSAVIPIQTNFPDTNTIPVVSISGNNVVYGEIQLRELREFLLRGKGNIRKTQAPVAVSSRAKIYPPQIYIDEVNATTRFVKPKLEIMWDGLTWTDETSYFISAKGDQELGGELGESSAAQADFELENTTKRFTKNAGSPIDGYLKPRVPIRFGIDFGETGYYMRLFTGYIKTYKPNKLSGVCNLHCFDNTQFILNKEMKGVVYTNKRIDELIAILAEEAGLNSTQYELERGSLIPVAWFNNKYINPLMSELAVAERGRVFFDNYGKLRFWNREHLHSISTMPNKSLTYVDWIKKADFDISETAIKNRVVIQAQPRAIAELDVVWTNRNPELYNQYSETLLWIPARGMQNAWIELDDPCTNWQTPLANTDYVANTEADGSGTDMTNSVVVSYFKPYDNAAFLIVNNNASVPVYFTKFQLRAQLLQVSQYIKADFKDQNSIDNYGEQMVGPIENQFINSEELAKDIAYEELHRRSGSLTNFKIEIIGDPMFNAGEVVEIELEDGSKDNYLIERMDWTLDEQGGYRQELDLIEPFLIPKKVEIIGRANIINS